MGPEADCDRCGCAVPFWLHSFEDMDPETMGKMFGPAASKYVKYMRGRSNTSAARATRPTEPPPPVLHQISAAKPLDN